MSKPQNAVAGLVEIFNKTSASLLAAEIIRGRAFLGAETTQVEREQLVKKPLALLTQEAQAVAVAVALRQQNEAAEYMRRTIAAQEGPGGRKTGPLMS